MSRGYRIRWPQPAWKDASTRVASEDAMCMDVGVLEILPEDEMIALLRAQLEKDGWSKGQDGALSRSFGEVTAELAPDGRTLTARATVSREVTARGTTEAEAQAKLGRAQEAASKELDKKVAERLDAAEGEVRAAVQAALQRVYVEALQRKAASLGEIESMQEVRGEGGELELTIKVRV